MSFEEPNNPRSSEFVNNQIQLTELATYEERTPGVNAFRNAFETDINLIAQTTSGGGPDAALSPVAVSDTEIS